MRPRSLASLGLVLLLAVPGQAGHAEEATGGAVTYQFDAGTHHDAPDRCLDASTAWSVAVGSSTYAMVVPGEDIADHIVFNVPAALVGGRLQVSVAEASGSPNVDLGVLAPDCEGDVFDPANLPVPFPMPPLPAAGEVQVQPENLVVPGPQGCHDGGWHFLVTQLEGLAIPASIHVAWTDGTEATIPVAGSGDGSAWYATSLGTDYTLKGVWANVGSAWEGRFRILTGPCDAQDGGAVYGDPPVRGDDVITFTPIRSGLHIVQATAAEPQAPAPGTSMPASCHYCFGPTSEEAARRMSYRLAVLQV